ncbi:MAG: cell division protein FtsQ/DivIB [Pseudomonadota bacterium]
MRSVRRDPAPSRWAYRLNRIMLTPGYRRFMRLGLPALALAAGAVWAFGDTDRREAMHAWARDIRVTVEERPEFAVKMMAVEGTAPEIADAVREAVPIDFPVSSFALDLDFIKRRVTALPAVREAHVRLRAGGVLEVAVSEREPVLLWRDRGMLWLIDAEGVAIATAPARRARPDLPLVAGEGADDAAAEALALFAAAGPVASELRGLVRVGERRWDAVLTGGQIVMLPEQGATEAFARTIALDRAQDILSRDVTAVDMRNPQRPTLRLGETASALRRTTVFGLQGEQ